MIKPSIAKERIDAIDIVRGFALFGIFLVNMPAFFLPFLYIDQQKAAETFWDKAVVIFIDIVAQANFYTLFSFLFGFGTIFFYERLKEKELRPLPFLLRRFTFLLVLGLIHAILIWHGDILITYAITAIILILFLSARGKSLLIHSIAMIAIPYLAIGLLLLMSGTGSLTEKPTSANDIENVYQSGSYVEITMQRISDYLYVHGGFGMVFVVISLLPMFLLGAYFAKEKLFHQASEHKEKLKKIAIITLAIGIPLKVLPYFTDNLIASMYQDGVGGPLMAIGYATSIVLLVEAKIGLKVLAPLRYIGRLSLSNYILQSVICTLLFYSYGFGLYGSVTNKVGLLLTVVIFIMQIFISKWWLARYQYGPLEWLWRTVTYKNVLAIKKKVGLQNKIEA
ncbi:DUF418 domain-containing protein [Lottiidibacillus patelloidae]|uniref:DUF418 domain-containing protein n=1 Tax=Lottiidibacillus patelloidae TaxID=2670334 RepID=UPI0013037358|nr:DUF418 domain-containing protein [Lottiidibacillus patelloidae]